MRKRCDVDKKQTQRIYDDAYETNLKKLSQNNESKKQNNRKKKEIEIQTNISHHMRYIE